MRGWTRLKADILGSGAAWKARQHWRADLGKDNHPLQNTQSWRGEHELLMLSRTVRQTLSKTESKVDADGGLALEEKQPCLQLVQSYYWPWRRSPRAEKAAWAQGCVGAPAPLKLSRQSQLCEESSRYNESITQFILKNILHFNKKKGFMSGNSHLQTLKCFCLHLE